MESYVLCYCITHCGNLRKSMQSVGLQYSLASQSSGEAHGFPQKGLASGLQDAVHSTTSTKHLSRLPQPRFIHKSGSQIHIDLHWLPSARATHFSSGLHLFPKHSFLASQFPKILNEIKFTYFCIMVNGSSLLGIMKIFRYDTLY